MNNFDQNWTPEPMSGCRLWTGGRTAKGYGTFWHDGKSLRAHRFAWVERYGEIPDGLNVLHRCDVRSCVNPDHLFLGTHRDNALDAVSKGRNTKLPGESNPNVGLQESDVREIRKSRFGLTKLSELHGVCCETIRRARSGQTWGHVK